MSTPEFEPITLPVNWEETERGNVFLLWPESGDGNAWIRLPKPDYWLQVAWRRENYPTLSVSVIESNDAQLIQHIIENCGGMTIRKLNLNVPGRQELIERMIEAGEVLYGDDVEG